MLLGGSKANVKVKVLYCTAALLKVSPWGTSTTLVGLLLTTDRENV